MNYKVESDFFYNGYRCVVIMTRGGHRCGYVGISKTHPLHGVDYSSSSEILKTDDMSNISIDAAGLGQMLNALIGKYDEESITPEMYFSVHGGITYSGGQNYPVESDGLWWFGYDCAHSGDANDLDAIEDEGVRKIEMMVPSHGIVRTKEYCEQECINLAEQLMKVADKTLVSLKNDMRN